MKQAFSRAPKNSQVCADMTGSTGEAENLRMANLNKHVDCFSIAKSPQLIFNSG